MKHGAALIALAALGALFAATSARASFAPADDGADLAPEDPQADTFDIPFLIAPEDRPDMGYSNPDTEQRNIEAFGTAVAKAEGTAGGPNAGYDCLFGWPALGRAFDSNSAADHPRRLFPFTDLAGIRKNSSAAGRYQENAPTYDDIRRRYGLPAGFTPTDQERHFVALLQDCGALDDVKAGRFEAAVSKARTKWASLPGSGNDQPERSLAYVRTAYINAGGTVA